MIGMAKWQLRLAKPRVSTKAKRIFLILSAVVLLLVLPQYITLPQPASFDESKVSKLGGSFLDISDTLRIYYEEYGDPSGPVVLFIHGFGGSTDNWFDTLGVVAAQGYRVIALDLPGFGLSRKGYEQSYSHAAQAAAVGQFMDLVGVNDVTIVGHSMGGNVALHSAFALSTRVKKLILVAPAVVNIDAPSQAITPFVLNKFPAIKTYMQLGLRLLFNPNVYLNIYKGAFHTDFDLTERTTQYADLVFQTPNWDLALIAIWRDAANNNLPKSLSELKIPVHLIWGKNDEWVDISQADTIVKEVQGSTLDSIENSGHLPMVENSVQFNQLLLKRLGTVGGSSN